VVKGIKSGRKIKEKEKRSLDPGHYCPDLDAGPGSGFWFRIRTRIRICGSESLCGLNARTFRTFFTDLPDFPGSVLSPGRYAACVCVKRGDLRSIKIWVKEKNRRCSGHYYFLNCAQVFTRGEGGIGGPNSPFGALGSPGKYSHNLFYQNKPQDPRVCFFTITFILLFVRLYVRERIKTGSKILTIQQKTRSMIFGWFHLV
jgi:hypothetical protein